MASKLPKIIILPGWGGTKETWTEFIKLASNEYDVECINLPCFGDEPCPETIWGVEEYSEFVKAKLNQQEAEIILLGHSFGGQIAANVAAHSPEKINKLILVAPALFRPKDSIRRFIFTVVAKFGKIIFRIPFLERFDVLAKKILYRAANSPDYAATSGIKRDIFKKVIREDLTQILPKINTPTLIIWGTHDRYTPFSGARKTLQLISNSQLETIENGTHGPHLQNPQNLYALVKRFLDKDKGEII